MYEVQGILRVGLSGDSPVLVDAKGSMVRISPDGSRLLMNRVGSPLTFTMSLDGSNATPLSAFATQTRIESPEWSPDGTAIDYISADGQLWRQPLNGSASRKLTEVPQGIDSWAWSRDGSQLAVTRGTSSSDAVLIRDRSEH